MRHLLDKVHVFGAPADLEVTNQCAKRRAPEGAELFFIDLLEQRRLVEVDGRLEVLDDVLLARVEQLDLQALTCRGVLAQVVQARPAGFDLLELGGVQHLAELGRDQLIDFGNAGVDVGRQVVGHHHGAVQHFLDQLANDVLGAGVLGVGLGHLAAGDDVVQQAEGVDHFTGLGLQLGAHGITPVQSAGLRRSAA